MPTQPQIQANRRIARIETGLLSDRLDDLRDDLELDAPHPGPDGLPDHALHELKVVQAGRATARLQAELYHGVG